MDALPSVNVPVSGERFTVTYRLTTTDPDEAQRMAQGTALEQSVELGASQVPAGDMTQHVIGQVEQLAALDDAYETVISYPVELTSFNLPGLLNVMFSNISMKAGIKVMALDLPDSFLEHVPGPQFGTTGVRDRLGVPQRALLGTAIKPAGFPVEALAKVAYEFALGGIDIIKEDHLLMDQPWAPFRERVPRLVQAVQDGAAQGGHRALFVPHITAPTDQLLENAHFAREAGADGLEIMPGITGHDVIGRLRNEVNLPIFTHPGMLGTYAVYPHGGIDQSVIYGTLPRLAGADVTLYTNYGGRFPTTRAQCRRLQNAITRPLGRLPSILPMPGGGMTRARVPELLEFYGRDVILLISGDLLRGESIAENSRRFREAVITASEVST